MSPQMLEESPCQHPRVMCCVAAEEPISILADAHVQRTDLIIESGGIWLTNHILIGVNDLWLHKYGVLQHVAAAQHGVAIAGGGVWKAPQHEIFSPPARQTNAVSEEYASCWVHQDCHVADVQKAESKKAAGASGGKDECQVRLKGREHEY